MKQLQLQHSTESKEVAPMVTDSRRIPIERKVVLKFHHFGGFFIEYSANVSLTGMFIRTEQPKPAGSIFIFEIWLGDEYKLVHGVGEVVWVRSVDEGDGRPAGMGVRYLKIDDESRKVIQRVISEHVMKGGTVFEITAGAEGSISSEERRADIATVEPISVPMTEDDLLELDEEVLNLEWSVDATGSQGQPVESGRPSRGVRLALLLAILAALAGGAAYLVGADLLPF